MWQRKQTSKAQFILSQAKSAYSDDVVMVTRPEARMRELYREMGEKPPKIGLTVNEKEAKYVVISAAQKG